MPFSIEFADGAVLEWHATADGARVRCVPDYEPTIYVASRSADGFSPLESVLHDRTDVSRTSRERWRTAFRNDPESVLRIDVTSIDRVRPLSGWIRRYGRPGTYRLFNVDLSPGFRYCLERDVTPLPDRELRTLELGDPTPGVSEAPVTAVDIGGESPSCDRIDGDPEHVIGTLSDRLEREDPDVLVCSSAELVPALFETATAHDCGFQLGRRPGYEQLAGATTYESYGRVGHSPARYNVPGRVIVDLSNTFFYHETNLEGCLDLVERSRKPLQELSWASIGNVLTAIQIGEALARGVLVPWKSWRHELPKTMRQLHEGDRGGFTFAPAVGVHEDVHELDFSSLYPNIIRTRNVSPETVRCECHPDRQDVPDLGYSICEQPGYLPDVLGPIIDDRDAIKAELEALDDAADPARRDALSGRSAALKWILVSCFGYQGFSNAKFGRIECHEAINAFAREILLDAKAALEDAGWRVLHGIVDSLWITAREDATQQRLSAVVETVTSSTEIRLEQEATYDWIAFVPVRDGEAGALTKYFGRRCDGEYKYRGIECRQRSTPSFVADCQRDLIDTFDATRDPAAVCDRLAVWIDRLESGVDPARLRVTRRTSKRADEYTRRTRTVAALQRADDRGIAPAPGQDVEYVVVDDDKRSRDRVKLAHEADDYDADFYRERLIRAAESVLSPVGWTREEIEAALGETRDATLRRFHDARH
ncbi:type B DNA-directed DNA polymerase [Halalkaliarchaeum desulfuricum]|nr:type B DNA-directed DNA polymerase [Halalkaliarchaeum desulfuricum]